MANEELLEALNAQEKRLALAAWKFIEAGREAHRHAVRKTIGSSISTTIPPQHQEEFDRAETKFLMVVAGELGLVVNDKSSVYTQLLKLKPSAPDAMKRFSQLRSEALSNAHVIFDPE